MNILNLIKAINRIKVQTGSLVCLGCGHENSCAVHGCAILREAADQLDAYAGPFGEQSVLLLAAQALDSTPERLRELAQLDKAGELDAIGSQHCSLRDDDHFREVTKIIEEVQGDA